MSMLMLGTNDVLGCGTRPSNLTCCCHLLLHVMEWTGLGLL